MDIRGKAMMLSAVKSSHATHRHTDTHVCAHAMRKINRVVVAVVVVAGGGCAVVIVVVDVGGGCRHCCYCCC